MNRDIFFPPAPDQLLIEFENVSFRYPGHVEFILKDMNIRIGSGEWIAVMGRNGSGKSTLAKLMNGLLSPTIGNVLVEHRNTRDADSLRSIRAKVGLVFQNPEDQMIGSTVEDDIAFGLQQLDISEQEAASRVHAAIQDFDLADLTGRSLSALSGGQKQRVAIASIYALRPRVIVLDESTSMLSPYDAEEIMAHIRRLHEQGVTIIHITNNAEDMWNAQRLIIFHEQKITYDGAADSLFPVSDALEQAGLQPPFLLRMQAHLHHQSQGLPNVLRSEREMAEALWTSILRM